MRIGEPSKNALSSPLSSILQELQLDFFMSRLFILNFDILFVNGLSLILNERIFSQNGLNKILDQFSEIQPIRILKL